ncbi:MAG: hypothetical protein JKY15_01940 [Deltaproteobacteria bacterium]|nr:hypothetical protein [Deltaproteobacteria bacterium]
MLENFIQSFILVIAGIIGTVISALAIYFIKKKTECFTAIKQATYDSKEDIMLIKKFLAIQSRMIDETQRFNHPKDSLELEKLAKQMFNE